MVTGRLTSYLEQNNIISTNQSGFRKNKSTIDQIIRLQNDIKTANHQHKYVATIFIDFSKAFDMVWKDGLLYKLKRYNITGKKYTWISQFLSNRKIQVKVGNEI